MPGAGGRVADLSARILDAIADRRPAVVAAGERAVQLVAAARAVLVGPQLARIRVERRALYVAVPVGPDLRQRAGTIHERIVGRHLAVALDAHHLAEVRVERLRAGPLREAVAERHEQPPVAREHSRDPK